MVMGFRLFIKLVVQALPPPSCSCVLQNDIYFMNIIYVVFSFIFFILFYTNQKDKSPGQNHCTDVFKSYCQTMHMYESTFKGVATLCSRAARGILILSESGSRDRSDFVPALRLIDLPSPIRQNYFTWQICFEPHVTIVLFLSLPFPCSPLFLLHPC